MCFTLAPPALPTVPAHSNAKRQLKAALAERDAQVQRVNELTQQLQDKKRQLFTAIQVRRHGVAHELAVTGEAFVQPPQCCL